MDSFVDLVKRRRPLLGTWVQLAGTAAAEIACAAGFDFVLVDGQMDQARAEFIRCGRSRGKILGIIASDLAAARQYRAEGFDFIALTSDRALLQTYYRELTQAWRNN